MHDVTDAPIGYQPLALATLIESPKNTRRHWPAKAQADLERSIKTSGILTPLLVRPIDGGRYEIAAGHRRYRAAKKAKLVHVPAIVRPMTDAELLEIITIENLQREDLHPLDEAAGLEQLLQGERSLANIEGVAARVGKSVSYVYQRLKLLALAPEIQEAFLADFLTAGHAILLARLPATAQATAFEQWLAPTTKQDVDRDPMSVRDLAQAIADSSHRLKAAPFDLKDDALVPAAGACTTCPKRSDRQAELFDEVPSLESGGRTERGARCLDTACWAAKVAAKIERSRTELAAAGTPIVEIAAGYVPYGEPLPAGVQRPGTWTEVPKGTKGSTPAVVVAGSSTDHQLGQIVHVRLGRPKRKLSAAEIKERKDVAAATAKRAATLAVAEALQRRVLEKLSPGKTVPALLASAAEILLGFANQELGIDSLPGAPPRGAAARAKWRKGLKPAKALYFLQVGALAEDLLLDGNKISATLLAAAKELRIDAKKVAAEVRDAPK